MQRSLSDEPAGIIELSQTFEFGIIPPDPKQKRGPNEEFQFQVTRPGRVYVLCAPNAAVRCLLRNGIGRAVD